MILLLTGPIFEKNGIQITMTIGIQTRLEAFCDHNKSNFAETKQRNLLAKTFS